MNQTCSNCDQLAADNQRLREALGNCVSAARSYRSDLLRLDANTNFNSSEMKQCGLTADDSHVDEMRDPKLKAALAALAAAPATPLDLLVAGERRKVLEEVATFILDRASEPKWEADVPHFADHIAEQVKKDRMKAGME